jgi:hypothetical protein
MTCSFCSESPVAIIVMVDNEDDITPFCKDHMVDAITALENKLV